MAKTTFDTVVQVMIDGFEKGFVHRSKKADPGGATKYGITRKTLGAWHSRPVSIKEVKELTKDEAIDIYRAQYWNTIRGDDLPVGVDFCIFDFAVNSGPGRAVKTLQEVLQVKQDGIIGLVTMAAIDRYNGGPKKLIASVCAVRLKFMKGLSNWTYNKNGWTTRVKHVLVYSQSLTTKGLKLDMAPVSSTASADGGNLSVSKALLSKESVTLLTVAIPSISGLLTDFSFAKYIIAAFVAAFGCIGLYWSYQRVKKEQI